MTITNTVGNSLSGQNGDGSFSGSESPSFSGVLDCSSSYLIIPNSSSPVVDESGKIAVDTSISGFKPLIIYHDGSSQQAIIAVNSANLSTTNEYIVSYELSSSQFVMKEDVVQTGISMIQSQSAVLGSDSSTNSTSWVSTGLQATITPTNSLNDIIVDISGYYEAAAAFGGTSYRICHLSIYDGSSTELELETGRRVTSSSSLMPSYGTFNLKFKKTAGSTSPITFTLRMQSENSDIQTTIFQGASISIHEIEV